MSDYQMGKDFAEMGMLIGSLRHKTAVHKRVINHNARVLKTVIDNQEALRGGLLGLCVACFCYGVAGLIQDWQLSKLEERVSKLENENKNRPTGPEQAKKNS